MKWEQPMSETISVTEAIEGETIILPDHADGPTTLIGTEVTFESVERTAPDDEYLTVSVAESDDVVRIHDSAPDVEVVA